MSYVDLLQLTSRRQHDLERQYYFTCDCDRCQDSRKVISECAVYGLVWDMQLINSSVKLHI